MSTLVWLASYPKSGNTWLRVFLANYVRDAAAPADINALDGMLESSSRWLFDLMAGFASARLPFETVDSLRPAIYRHYAALDAELKFLKVHDAWRATPAGEPLFPPEATRGAVYVVRDPLDVALSYAFHENTDVDAAIDMMSDPDACLARDARGSHAQFPQAVGTWSEHVRGWTERAPCHVHVVRYEDLIEAPDAAFGGIVRFLGLAPGESRLRKAIEFSRFAELRRQEDAGTFYERKGDAPFFRSGRGGAGRDALTRGQVDRIVAAHAPVMRRFGYLPGAD